MVEFYDGCKIVALLDKPSSESFGICPLLTRDENEGFYRVRGLSSGIKTIIQEDFDKLGGHILEIDSKLPIGLSNPIAMWRGYQFCANAKALGAAVIPEIDESWSRPLEPHQESGHYKIRSCGEAFEILDGWVNATGIVALTRNDYALARLMSWALPSSPVTMAALYFASKTEEDKQSELEWQLRTTTPRRNITLSELVQEHEETRRQLIS